MLSGALLVPVSSASGQIKVDLKKKLTREVNQRVNNRVDRAIDKSLDQIENEVDSLLVKNQKGSSSGTDHQVSEEKGQGDRPASKTEQLAEPQSDTSKEPEIALNWKKVAFIPGSALLFADDVSGELNGEFPSRGDMTGGTMDVAQFGEDMVVVFRSGNTNRPDAILPYLKNRHEDYLPEAFTIEFDAYFSGKSEEISSYSLFLYDVKNQATVLNPIDRIAVYWNKIAFGSGQAAKYPGTESGKGAVPASFVGWRHISVSFNQRSLKTYMDDARLLNIPNCEFNPTGIMLSFHNPSGSRVGYIKNVRLAKGAVPLYDKFLVEGKFVTTGITFDVNKATLKPESMGILNYVVTMMKDHPELRFSVEGHTDADGDEAFNQKLSEARSKAVVDQLIFLGIDPSRLSSAGFGESRQIDSNDSPEGKARNQRVEFVKL